MDRHLRLIEGGKGKVTRDPDSGEVVHDLPFVCPWCGERFPTRSALAAHWDASATCSNNRSANNATQSKNMGYGEEMIYPGEQQLRRVREKEEDDE